MRVFRSNNWNRSDNQRKVLAMKGAIAEIALLFVLCTTGLGQSNNNEQPKPTGTALQNASATDLYEAVLRYQIKSWELAADSYCVEVKGKNASKGLLRRMQPLSVKGASSCRTQTKLNVKHVVDKKTGKMSVIFDMGEIRWRSDSEADVEGGYNCGNFCMAEGTYHIKWNGTQWAVTKFEIYIQS